MFIPQMLDELRAKYSRLEAEIDRLTAELAKAQTENERLKYERDVWKAKISVTRVRELEAENKRLRDALLKVANWYEDVHDTADFSGDTPSSYAKEFLVRSGVKV